MKKLFAILCAVVAVFAMASCSSSSPKSTVDAYYKALKAGDFEKALTYTDITDQEAIKDQLEKYKGFDIKILDYEILSETVSDDGNSAVVQVKQSMTSSFNKEPKEDTKDLKLVKVDGKWKIHD